MGYTTDFVGHIDIAPRLNDHELRYLDAFSRMRHFDRGGSPYEVPRDSDTPERSGVDIDAYNQPAPDKPQLYCQWAPCNTGCCLSHDGTERFYALERWLRYLIAHLLKPGARAARSSHPQLAGFTFDHRLDGMVVGCRRDTRELFSLTVTNNRVTRRVLRQGDPMYVDLPPLAYQEELDRWAEEALPAQVIDLTTRRGRL